MHVKAVAEARAVIVLEVKRSIGAPGRIPSVAIGCAVAETRGDYPMPKRGKGYRGTRTRKTTDPEEPGEDGNPPKNGHKICVYLPRTLHLFCHITIVPRRNYAKYFAGGAQTSLDKLRKSAT